LTGHGIRLGLLQNSDDRRLRPGKPTDNAFIEACNGRIRVAFLAHRFLDLADAHEKDGGLGNLRRSKVRSQINPSALRN